MHLKYIFSKIYLCYGICRAVQFGRTLFGRSTFGRDSFVVPSLVDTRVLADTYLVDIVFWSTFW